MQGVHPESRNGRAREVRGRLRYVDQPALSCTSSIAVACSWFVCLAAVRYTSFFDLRPKPYKISMMSEEIEVWAWSTVVLPSAEAIPTNMARNRLDYAA